MMDEDDYLAHYGILRKSGRYPWGSGENEESRARQFVEFVKNLLNLGKSEAEIAASIIKNDKGEGLSLTELRDIRTIANAKIKAADIAMAERLVNDKGYSVSAAARRMDKNESTVRALLAPGAADKVKQLESIANMLEDNVKTKGYLDIGAGVENHLGVSPERLRAAVQMLKDKGYVVENVQVPQATTSNKTLVKVLAPEGTTYRDIKGNLDKIGTITDVSDDHGRSWSSIQPPISVDSKRIGVAYKEDGGDKLDGLIYIRPGAKDLDMGGSRYAQVRIAVDGTHYLKGMAVLKDDLPAGTDIVFNTNKSRSDAKILADGKKGAFKKLEDDPENPFGTIVRQLPKLDENGKAIPDTVRSALNIVNEEGKWGEWSNTLSSQMLSKQSHLLAERQLKVAHEIKRDQLDEIMSLTNPAVKRRLLEDFADGADSAAWHLKAANMPGQGTHVILPIPNMKDTEVYAPNYPDGTRVALIRFPHGGTFEIPELTVNNRHPAAQKILGKQAPDAIGINAEVAKRLSGADFDGDTVLVIPNTKGMIKSTPPLQGLKDFDPQKAYPKYEGMKRMSPEQKQTEMGKVSNLITDMTIRGAKTHELAAAVRHSMVVIDAEKHSLNWKQSEIDNGIRNLAKKYQAPYNETGRAGASTLVSRRKSEIKVPLRKVRGIDPETGEKIYSDPVTYTNREGQQIVKYEKRKKLEVTDDAHNLSSGTLVEKVYADHSNRMKALANEARKAAVNTPTQQRSPSAAKVYKKEVDSLEAKLNEAFQNKPRERQAQLLADAEYRAKRAANPDMDRSEEKKVRQLALEKARRRTGAGKTRIVPSPSEWAAIQAGAISNKRLKDIMDNADLDEIKKLATPKAKVLMTSSKLQRAQGLLSTGLTQAEVADILGVSLTTLKRGLKGE